MKTILAVLTPFLTSSTAATAGASITSGRDKFVADVSAHTCVVRSFSFADAKLN